MAQPNYIVFVKLMAAKQACTPATHHKMGETDSKVRHSTCKNRKFKNQSHHRHFHCHLLCKINKAADNFYFAVATLRYAIKSALSPFFLIPAKIIFVPGIYFFGFSKYSIRVSSPQVIPKMLKKKKKKQPVKFKIVNTYILVLGSIFGRFLKLSPRTEYFCPLRAALSLPLFLLASV